MPPLETKLDIKINPVVAKGFTTYLGMAGAIVGYGTSVIVFLTATDQEAALAPFAAATLALCQVLAGRYSQATAAIAPHGSPPSISISGAPVSQASYAGSQPRPHAGGSFQRDDPAIVPPTAEPEEDPDPDGLPDYSTHDMSDSLPPDEGDAGQPGATA